MACPNMHYWSVAGLVAAFLDLAIAYFLLCASTMAFVASEFLGFFGLKLPCPCDGMFTNHLSNYCLQRLLVDYPTEKVSSVQLAVKNKFPFHSALAKDQNGDVNLVGDRRDHGNGYYVEMDSEASCSSVSDAKVSKNVFGRELISRNGNGAEFDFVMWPDKKLDLKGKGISNYRRKVNIRRRRKGGFDQRKTSSVSSYDQSGVPQFFSCTKEDNTERFGDRSPPDETESSYLLDDMKALRVTRTRGSGMLDADLKKPMSEMNPKEKNESSDADFRSDAIGALTLGDDINTINVLEQALKEEHTARAALYIELEKERSAAASAADEAMAMILRLQEEKASIEMQARQYQRIIEEKSAYDAEEMNILKEIVLRREREKHFLEKEVEAYRQMLYSGNDYLEGDIQSMVDKQRREISSSLDLSEDTDLMLHELNASIKRNEATTNRSPNTAATNRSPNVVVTSKETLEKPRVKPGSLEWDEADVLQHQGKDKHFSLDCSYDSNQELQEKEMVSIDDSQLAKPIEGQRSSDSQESPILETTIPFVNEEYEKYGFEDIYEGIKKNVDTSNISIIPTHSDDQGMKKHEKDATSGGISQCNVTNEEELHVYDVHVINDNSKLCNLAHGKKTDTSKVISASKVHNYGSRRNSSSTSRIDTSMDINRSSLDMAIGLPPSGSREKSLPASCRSSISASDAERLKIDTSTDFNRSSLDMAIGLPPSGSREKSLPASCRSSISVSDTERMKIDIEVEWLRKKLKAVRERRTKLNIPVDQDKEKMQLQLLEDIASQLREIRVMSQPEMATRQASLPPPSSKDMSKKRRCPSTYVNNSS